MKEIHSAGLKEFFIAVIWAAALFTLGSMSSYAVSVYKVISGIGTLLLLCVYAFFVLTRYSAVFTYSLEGQVLRVNRKIGHRNKEVEIRASQIVNISHLDPKLRPTYRMKKYILRNKRDCYVTYKKGGRTECLLFCPSDELLKKLRKTAKKASREDKNK